MVSAAVFQAQTYEEAQCTLETINLLKTVVVRIRKRFPTWHTLPKPMAIVLLFHKSPGAPRYLHGRSIENLSNSWARAGTTV